MANVLIDGFGERLEAIVGCMVHETLIVDGEARNLFKVSDIYEAMRTEPGFAERGKRTWERALAGSVPAEYLSFIYALYPAVRGVLEAPATIFDAFIGERLAARTDWEAAMRHLAANRHDRLHALAKAYYAEVDETQRPEFPIADFPLVARADWILKAPVELTEADPADLPPIVIDRIPRPPTLDGIELSTMALKSSVTLRKRLRRTGSAYWNGQCYRLRDIEAIDGSLRFAFGNATYFDYVNSCEARALELAREDLRSGGEIDARRLPIRVAPSDIYNLLGRSAFPGVNCVTIIRNYREPGAMDGEHDVYLLHYRDDSVLEAQNCVHVVPAGGHQPLSDDLEDRAASQVWATAAREFLEELRDVEELDHHDQAKAGHMDINGRYRELDTLFRKPVNGRVPARIFLLGVGFDPVTTKPEILVAIVVDWNRASQRIAGLQLIGNYEGKLRRERLRSSIDGRKAQLRAEARGLIHSPWGKPLPTLAAGAACFLLAAEHYEELVS